MMNPLPPVLTLACQACSTWWTSPRHSIAQRLGLYFAAFVLLLVLALSPGGPIRCAQTHAARGMPEEGVLLPPSSCPAIEGAQLTCARTSFRAYLRGRHSFLSACTPAEREALWPDLRARVAGYNMDAHVLPASALDRATLPHSLP